jgi:hypothetical protein
MMSKQIFEIGLVSNCLAQMRDDFHTLRPPFRSSPSPSHHFPFLHTSVYPRSINRSRTPSSSSRAPYNTKYRGHSCFHTGRLRPPAGVAGYGDGGNAGLISAGKCVFTYCSGDLKKIVVWSRRLSFLQVNVSQVQVGKTKRANSRHKRWLTA